MKVDPGDLVTYRQIATITGADIDTLRRWRARSHYLPIRDDLQVFQWSKVRPVIAARMGFDEDQWADVEIPPPD